MRRSCPSHCCPVHGCKYGYDDCPVWLGQVVSEFSMNNGCEQCAADREDGRPTGDLVVVPRALLVKVLGAASTGSFDARREAQQACVGLRDIVEQSEIHQVKALGNKPADVVAKLTGLHPLRVAYIQRTYDTYGQVKR